jgi:hypothetical protein
MNTNTPFYTSKIVAFWMVAISCIMMSNTHEQIQYGPNDKLYLFKIQINTYEKYMCIIIFCFINSILRSCNHNILQPWVTNEIQDTDKKNKHTLRLYDCYEIVSVSNIYYWFDFYIYMNILLSQIDFFVVEITADICISLWVTKYYLDKKRNDVYDVMIEIP